MGSASASKQIEVEGKTRSEYIIALKKADQGDYSNLLRFVRS